MADSDQTNLDLQFEILSQSNVKFDVQGFEGREYISRLYAFIVYMTTSASVDTASLVGERAKLTVTTTGGKMIMSGLCAQVEEDDPTPTDERVLRCLIRPRMSVTELVVESCVYGPGQPVGTDDVVKQELAKAPVNIPAEYNLDSYPKRRYVVQYDESDFAFVSRLCEASGIFYFFKQSDDGETVVFGDKNLAFPKVDLGGKSTILYSHPRDKGVTRKGTESAVLSFRQIRELATKSIKVRNYNENMPGIVSGEKDVGQGNAFLGKSEYFGWQFDDDGAGATLARIRAEQVAAGQTIFHAETDAPQLRAGTIFELQGHTRLNGEYLVVSAEHTAYRPAPVGFTTLPVSGHAYRNKLQCIRSNVPYRPALVTRRPTAVGLHTAKIDGEAWNGRAEIDNDGRYKLQMSFPDSQAPRARGSDYVRKVEPYVGPSQTGLHFPLIAGTEVIVGYINGDIDRPVVLGAVANPDMRHVVTGDSHTFNRIKSQSGALFEIYDGPA
jgi:type VI secretion system secreted protein VgrG